MLRVGGPTTDATLDDHGTGIVQPDGRSRRQGRTAVDERRRERAIGREVRVRSSDSIWTSQASRLDLFHSVRPPQAPSMVGWKIQVPAAVVRMSVSSCLLDTLLVDSKARGVNLSRRPRQLARGRTHDGPRTTEDEVHELTYGRHADQLRPLLYQA